MTAKRDFIGLKAEDDTLDINEFVNILAGLSNFTAKVNDLDIDKLETAPGDFEKNERCSG